MLSPYSYVNAVNLSVPEEVDAKLTKELLDKYDLKAAGSLVSNILPHIHTTKYGQAGCLVWSVVMIARQEGFLASYHRLSG